MRVDDFDFELPEERIALRPAQPRDAARLLVVAADGSLNDRLVGDLPDLLRAGDVLVFNDTRVMPTQLSGERLRDDGAARISATLIERIDAAGWWAFVKPGRRIAVGDRVRFGSATNTCLAGTLEATVAQKADDGRVRLDFDISGAAFDQTLAQIGAPPLPPYIAARRAGDARDVADYQTVYAAHDGAVAAPTAGLHFTERLFDALEKKAIERLRAFRNRRNPREVEKSIGQLEQACERLKAGEGELMPTLVDAARKGVTNGEMMDVMRGAFGWVVME